MAQQKVASLHNIGLFVNLVTALLILRWLVLVSYWWLQRQWERHYL